MTGARLRWQAFGTAVLGAGLLLSGCASTPTGVDAEQAAVANADLGADYLRKRDNARALSRFERALEHDANNYTANWGMAVVNDRLDNTAQADRYYRRTLDLRPTGDVLNSYGVFLCAQDDVDRAIDYFDRAVAAESGVLAAAAQANAGLCLHRAGRVEAAEVYHRRALNADPTQITALADMARLKYEQGDALRARAFLERADAAGVLDADQLLLASRIELALNDRDTAATYLQRYNSRRPSEPRSLRQLEPSR